MLKVYKAKSTFDVCGTTVTEGTLWDVVSFNSVICVGGRLKVTMKQHAAGDKFKAILIDGDTLPNYFVEVISSR